MKEKTGKIRVGVLPGLADLYNRLWGEAVRGEYTELISKTIDEIGSDIIEFALGEVCSTKEQFAAQVEEFNTKGVDMLLVVLGPYCASGVIAPSLLDCNTAVVLWPMQSIYEIVAKEFDDGVVKLNHGVHGVQDLSNVLGRAGRAFGLLHGHHEQDDFKSRLEQWAMAAKGVSGFVKSNPIQFGGHFEDMLDLQIGEAEFISQADVNFTEISSADFIAERDKAGAKEIAAMVADYKKEFEIADDVSDELLRKSAAGEIAVRAIMDKYDSKACGINFLELCNDGEIADGLHIAASRLMAEGKGYAAEGDWVTASFVYAMGQCFPVAGFSEMFSVDYKNNRLLLHHWGEGNPLQGRKKARILRSEFNDRGKAEFGIVDFEFKPGPATLINLNCDGHGTGQMITVTGHIAEDSLVKYTGPRAMFKPNEPDVREILDSYAYNGGSHHLVLVAGYVEDVIEKVAVLSGWNYIAL